MRAIIPLYSNSFVNLDNVVTICSEKTEKPYRIQDKKMLDERFDEDSVLYDIWAITNAKLQTLITPKGRKRFGKLLNIGSPAGRADKNNEIKQLALI